jgi:hypothetical protein
VLSQIGARTQLAARSADWDSKHGIVLCFMMLQTVGSLATVILSRFRIATIKHAASQLIVLLVNGLHGLGVTVTRHTKRVVSVKFKLPQLPVVSVIMIWFSFWLVQPLSILHKSL